MSLRVWGWTVALGAIIAVSMAAGAALAVRVASDAPASAPAAVQATVPNTQPVANVATPQAAPSAAAIIAAARPLPDVIEDVRRSVVAINTETIAAALGPFGPREFSAAGEGSGIVVDREGHILTNYHVVRDVDEIHVMLWDGTIAPATVVGVDEADDLAVLKASIQPQRLFPATFADSDTLRVGAPVFAIGNPFSYDFTVTTGIVSALGRPGEVDATGRGVRGMIQTDTALNPGNSGGPLFSASGEVVGINTAIHNPNLEPNGTPSKVFVGIGLAIPSNTASRRLPDLIAGREIQHSQLGVSGLTLNAIRALDLRLDVERGVYLRTVGSGTAAERAGLRPDRCRCARGTLLGGGDVITAIDGIAVSSIEELATLIDRRDVGQTVALTVVREGREIAINATLAAWQGG